MSHRNFLIVIGFWALALALQWRVPRVVALAAHWQIFWVELGSPMWFQVEQGSQMLFRIELSSLMLLWVKLSSPMTSDHSFWNSRLFNKFKWAEIRRDEIWLDNDDDFISDNYINYWTSDGSLMLPNDDVGWSPLWWFFFFFYWIEIVQLMRDCYNMWWDGCFLDITNMEIMSLFWKTRFEDWSSLLLSIILLLWDEM